MIKATITIHQKRNNLILKSLKSKTRINELYKNGLTAHSYSLLLKFKLDEKSLFKEFCFTVSKKKFPRAVDRNRIKRLLREIVRNNSDSFPAGQFLVVYKNTKRPFFSSLKFEIEKLLNDLKS